MNDGNAELIIGTISSPSFPFSKIADSCSGQTLALGGQCSLIYRFSPITAGTFSSTSNIPSNDPEVNPVTLSLTGNGINLSVTPATYDFGNVNVKKKKKVTFLIKNSGNTSLLVTPAIAGPDASVFVVRSRIRTISLARRQPLKSLQTHIDRGEEGYPGDNLH